MSKRTRYILLYVVIILSLVLSVFAVKIPTIINLSSIALYFSAIAGYSGIMLLLWNFVLGTRSVVSLLFNDYAKIIKIHSWIGKYGTLLIFLHLLLIILSYGQSLLYVFLPSFSSEFENAITYGRTALWIILTIWISSALLKSRVSYRPWKYLHLGAYISAPFALLHIPLSGSSYNALLSAKLYFFITLIGFAIFALLRLRGALNLNKFSYSISRQQQAASDIYIFTLTPNNSNRLVPNPGQYIYIKYGWFSEDHPFSVLGYDQNTGIITIGYKIYGTFTKKLALLQPNQKVLVSGPFGDFTSEINNEAIVYIAGGIGITPFVQRILKESEKREQWLFYSNQSHESAAFLKPIQQSLKDKCITIYSREEPTNEQNSEFGRINMATFTKYLDDPKRFSYYICGPQSMVDSVSMSLSDIKVPNKNIHIESFNF